MRFDPFRSAIALFISALIAYGLASSYGGDQRMLLTAGSFVSLASALVLGIGARFDRERIGLNIRLVAGLFFIMAVISNLIFASIEFAVSAYVIINGIMLLVFALAVHTLNKVGQH